MGLPVIVQHGTHCASLMYPWVSVGRVEYYTNLCMKAVNQSVGRAIRHIGDYATIVLADAVRACATSLDPSLGRVWWCGGASGHPATVVTARPCWRAPVGAPLSAPLMAALRQARGAPSTAKVDRRAAPGLRVDQTWQTLEEYLHLVMPALNRGWVVSIVVGVSQPPQPACDPCPNASGECDMRGSDAQGRCLL